MIRSLLRSLVWGRRTTRLAPLVLAGLATPARAQTYSILAKVGDVVPGIGPINFVAPPLAVSDRGTAVYSVSRAGSPATFFLRGGMPLVYLGQLLSAPVGAQVGNVRNLELDPDETALSLLLLNGALDGVQSGVYRDAALLEPASAPVKAPGAIGASYAGFYGVHAGAAGDLLVTAEIYDPVVGASRSALVRWRLDPFGRLQSESVVARAGDYLAEWPALRIQALGTDFDSAAFDRRGHALYAAFLTSALGVGAPGSGSAILRDAKPLVLTGDSSPIAGATWHSPSPYRQHVALNDRGDFAFIGELSGSIPSADAVCKNNTTILALGGMGHPALGGTFTFRSGSFTWVALDASGNVFWNAEWHDASPGSHYGLFRNDELLVETGVTQIGNQVVESFVGAQAVSPDGRYLLVSCRLAGVGRAVLQVDFGTPTAGMTSFCSGDGTTNDHTAVCPCGNTGGPGKGCANSQNAAGAQLRALGDVATDDVRLESAGEPATAFTLFLQHAAPGDTVFHDGVLCASGQLVRLRGRAASSGTATFPSPYFALDSTTTLSQRGGISPGSGAVRYYAAWYRNASTSFCPPATANVTNGLVVTW